MAEYYYSSKDILDKAIGTDAYFQIKSILTSTRAADVAPVVHGRWEHDVDDCWICSVCGVLWQTLDGGSPEENDMKFCPCCGAIMDKEEP